MLFPKKWEIRLPFFVFQTIYVGFKEIYITFANKKGVLLI